GGVLKEARTIRRLLTLLRSHVWWLPAAILLGILSSLAEGIGLSLFVPLLQSLDDRAYHEGSSDGLLGFLPFLLPRLPEHNRLPYIAGLILAMTLSKAVLTYGHSLITASMNSRITHSIRSRMFSKLTGISQQTLDQTGSGRLINLLATD